MKLKCHTNDNNIIFTLINDNKMIYQYCCKQKNLCEKLPNIIDEISKKYTKINQDNIIFDLDDTKNITTKRILVSFFNGFLI